MKHWKPLVGGRVAALPVAGGWRATAAKRAPQQAQVQAAAQRTEAVVELAAADVVRARRRELRCALPISGSLKAVNSAFVKARAAGELEGLVLRAPIAGVVAQRLAQVEGNPRAIAAKVARIDPSAQAGSRSVLAHLALADTTGLRHGLFAQGTAW